MQKLKMTTIRASLEEAGFTFLGGFEIQKDDAIAMPGARYGVLAGNAGPEMFERFSRECDPLNDALDDWCRKVLGRVAGRLGAKVFFPFDKPHLPFQDFARRAGAGYCSPLGLNIHPVYGLWHAYRGLLVFTRQPEGLQPLPVQENPCSSCKTGEGLPCLEACPVGAFDGKTCDVNKCRTYLLKVRAKSCLNEGCKARLACPAGAQYRYSKAQMQFHMAAFAVSG